MLLCNVFTVFNTCKWSCDFCIELDPVPFFFFSSFLLASSVTTSAACEKLERDRNELQVAYEGYLQKLNQKHNDDLAEVEEKLKQFYTAECEKLRSICIEEAEKYKAQLQEQVCNTQSRKVL